MNLRARVAALIISTSISVPAFAQFTVALGQYPMGSYSGGPFDTINNGNLNASFSIPILSKAGPTVPFRFSLSYNSSVWYPATVNGTTTWTPVNATDWGWSSFAENVGTGGYVSYRTLSYSCLTNPGNPHPVYFNWYDSVGFVYHDFAGGSHPFGVSVTTFPPSGAPCGSDSNSQTATGVATDNSGFTISTNSTPTGSIKGQQGITFNVPFTSGTPSSTNATETTPNGNQVSSSVSGSTTTYTDALGMTALTATSTGSPVTQVMYTYSSTGNVAQHVVVKYSQLAVHTAFGCTSPTIGEFTGTEPLITEIDMADIATNPTDKYTFTYEYTPGSTTTYTGRLKQITLPTGGTIQYAYSGGSNGIQCSDGSTAGLTRTLSPGGAWGYTRTLVSGTEWKTTLTDPATNVTTMYFQFATPSGSSAALAYETERDLPGLTQTILTCYNGTPGTPSSCTTAANTTAITLPITRRTVKTTVDTQTSQVDAQLDSNGYGLPIDVTEYDWGSSGTPGTHLRETVVAYDYNTSCGITSGSGIVDRPCTITVNGNNNAGQWTAGITSASNAYDANGNLLSTTSGGLTKSATYNTNGTVATITDPNSNVTTFAYNGANGCSSAYQTSVTGPAPASLSTTVQWDCYAGVPTSVTDPNSKTISFGYDIMNRLASTSYPDGGSVIETYTPTQLQTTTKITSGVSRTDTEVFDGLGRVLSNSVAGAETDRSYDALGRLSTLTVKSSGQQDTYSYDAFSRLSKVTHADASNRQMAYSSNCVTATDESGKARQVCSDGLGRTNKVTEDPGGLNYLTTYAYDGLDDLIGVAQGTQQTCQLNTAWYSRCFHYDALRRMTSATTPESGTVAYTYDSDATCGTSAGDLVKRVDARSVRTCYGYDYMHRPTSMSYSDTTPSVSYLYDQTAYNGLTITNGLGRQTGMSDGSGQTAWSFDSMGRPIGQEKTISGVTKTMGYTYNYDGSLASLTYPSGRVITYGIDSLGRPATAVDNTNGINYVTGTCSGGACYAAQNALSSMITGKTASFAGITYSVSYNNRLQPSSISASSTSGSALSISYGYLPNGNVQTITNNRDTGRTTTYGYDSLNRINSASTQATTGADCWGQSVPSGGYDQYGNLMTINVSKCSAPSLSVSVNSKNQITNTGFNYDASGDQTSDGTHTYTWDAEGRMKSGAGVTYTFDGGGKRVKDSSPKLFWHGPGGTVLAETDSSGNTQNEYVFFGGMRVARRDSSGNVYYYFANTLGSAAITTAGGSLCYDADFYPLGGELTFINTCAQNYKFAGMERDPASGLDRTSFRHHSPTNGRWLSPDPLGRGAVSLRNPQTWNMYSYVTNNPVNFVDPSGLDGCDPAEGMQNCQWGFIGQEYYDASYNGPPPALGPGCVTSYCPGAYGGETWNEGGTSNNEWENGYSDYEDSVSATESGGNVRSNDPNAITIWVQCFGTLTDLTCRPANFDRLYFANAYPVWYSDPDAHRLYVFSNQLIFDSKHMLGNDYPSACAGTFAFLGDSAFWASSGPTFDLLAGGAQAFKAGYMTKETAELLNEDARWTAVGATGAGGMNFLANSFCP